MPRQSADLDDPMALEMDFAYTEFLKSELKQHTLPSTSLGTTGGSLPSKFHAVLHSIFLECGNSETDLVAYCNQICACTTDLGTEFALPFISPMPLISVFPWIRGRPPTPVVTAAGDDDFHLLDACHDFPHQVSFASSLAISGLLHIIHNAASNVLTVTEILDGQVDSLAKVCSILADRQSCTRLIETCYNSPVGQQLQHKLSDFSCRVYRPRWGSVAFCCRALLEVKSVLLYGWSVQKYQRGMGKVGSDLESANNAITSPLFWASMLVLNHLYDLVRLSFQWAEGCPCHSNLDWTDISKELRQQWESCPLRGLRVPEVCAGDFFSVFEKLQNEAAVSLVAALGEISEVDKAKLLQDFERGRSFLLHTFALKLSAFTVPPLLVCAAAHHSTVVSHNALRVCLHCDDEHPQIKKLQSHPLNSQAQEFLDGVELAELPELGLFHCRSSILSCCGTKS